MAKIHTRVKRKFKVAHHKAKIPSGIKKKGPKTFKSEEAAKKYAIDNNIKSYSLHNSKSLESKRKKLRIVVNQ